MQNNKKVAENVVGWGKVWQFQIENMCDCNCAFFSFSKLASCTFGRTIRREIFLMPTTVTVYTVNDKSSQVLYFLFMVTHYLCMKELCNNVNL
jgi:hypothetical protein